MHVSTVCSVVFHTLLCGVHSSQASLLVDTEGLYVLASSTHYRVSAAIGGFPGHYSSVTLPVYFLEGGGETLINQGFDS